MVKKLILLSDELDVRPPDVCSFIGAVGESACELFPLIDSAIQEMSPLLTPRACYDEYDIRIDGKLIDLGFAKIESEDLAKHIKGCRKIILIAATVGIGADRLIAKYSLTEPSRALVMQAVGAAAVECFLDKITPDLGAGRELCRRFSCGYGDLPLELQKDIFAALSCEKNIGVTLNTSLLMTPTKSVTAIIGIKNS